MPNHETKVDLTGKILAKPNRPVYLSALVAVIAAMAAVASANPHPAPPLAVQKVKPNLGSVVAVTTLLDAKTNPITGGNQQRYLLSTNTPAAADTVFTLGTSGPVLAPATVTLPSGQSSVTFYGMTTGVNFPQSGSVNVGASGIYPAASVNFSINPAQAARVTINTPTLYAGQTATGTVTLDGLAGPSGTVVSLSSNDSHVTVPSNIVVPSGQRTANFTVAGPTDNTSTGKVTVQASTSGQGAKMIQSLDPVSDPDQGLAFERPFFVADMVANFATLAQVVSVSTTVSYDIDNLESIQFAPSTSTAGTDNGIIFKIHAPAGISLTYPLTWTLATGKLPASVTFPPNIVQVSLRFTPDAIDSAGSIDCKAVSSPSFNVHQTATLVPSTLSKVYLTGANGGFGGSGSVLLNGLAGPSGVVVSLNSTASFATFPASVTVPGGSNTANFNYSTTGVDSDQTVSVTATRGSASFNANATVKSAKTSSLVPLATTVTGGTRTGMTLRIDSAAGPSGVTFQVLSNDSHATVPATVTIPAGKVSVGFAVNTTPTGSTPKSVIITCTGPSGVASSNQTITVN